MKFKLKEKKTAEIGDRRIRKSFAWIPVIIYPTVVWLEFLWYEEYYGRVPAVRYPSQFVRYRNKWIFSAVHEKNPTAS